MRFFILQLIRAYRLFISPFTVPACRYHPTCSQYAVEAVEIHGSLKGSFLAIKRLLRCHPFVAGGYDPVPPVQQKQDSCNCKEKGFHRG